MFKLKFAIGFAILVLLQVSVSLYLLQGNLIPLTMEDADISLQRAASLVEKSHRIDEYSLKEKARFVASRNNLRRAMVKEYDGDVESKRFQEVHKRLDTEHIRFTEFMAPENEGRRNLDLDLMNRRPMSHDIFMALDDTGRLAAALGSGRSEFMGDEIASRFPIVLGVMEGDQTEIDLWNWSWDTGGDRDLYAVAISPMRDLETNEPIGVVVLGNRVTDGVAERSRSLITDGLASDGSDPERSEREEVLAPEVTYFRGDRIYSSTLRSRQVDQLNEQLYEKHQILEHDQPETILDVTIDGQDYRAVVRYFPGQFDTDNPAGVILMTNRGQAMLPFQSARSRILLASGGLLVGGLVLFLYLFFAFLQPLGRLEDGIQEILSGDKDYVFETDKDHDIADNLAHHLNLLSAFLQGKPMPDDEHSLGGWETFEDEEETSSPASVAGVPMDIGGTSNQDDDGDSSEEDTDASDAKESKIKTSDEDLAAEEST